VKKTKRPPSIFIEDERDARGTTSVRFGVTETSFQVSNNTLVL
jgi:hypothetical protein